MQHALALFTGDASQTPGHGAKGSRSTITYSITQPALIRLAQVPPARRGKIPSQTHPKGASYGHTEKPR